MPFSSNPNSYDGRGLPNAGAAHFQQESTKDALTLEHTSANAGRFVTFRDYKAPESGKPSTDAGQDLAWISDDGAFQGPLVSIVSPTTGANYQITSTQSGSLFNIGINNGTSQLLLLPANPVPGFWFKVYVSTQAAAGDFQINSTADSSAAISIAGGTSAVSTVKAIAPKSTLGNHSVTMTAISSVLWLAEPGYQVSESLSSGAINADDYLGGVWGAATTAA